ncbi:MAG TPA: sulfite exporter TauE/SafE family protein [Acidimicrobiales bacterium]|nr:sulfite exporter TauE/SafE family protein [Acidimicrobiales bacterium]
MALSAAHYLVAAGAGLLAGLVNAVAGGGTLISFPALQAVGLPAVGANVTNIVALTPGYLAGSLAQRADLEGRLRRARRLSVLAALGGLAGSLLLVSIPARAFRAAVPFLLLASCGLLVVQDALRARLARRARHEGADRLPPELGLWAGVFLAAVYGGFFGAGLGIMLLAILGLFSEDTLARNNALKQALSLVISLVASCFLAFSGHVVWSLAAVMAVTGIVGGALGGRFARVARPGLLRALVVAFGIAVAVRYWA